MKTLPTLLLEKLALNELSPAERARVDAALTPAEQAAAVAELERHDATFLDAYPAEGELAAIRHKAQAARFARRRQQPHQLLPLLIAAACLVMLIWTKPWSGTDSLDDGDIRLKGQTPHLVVYRKLKLDFERLETSAVAHRGDVLQIRYVASGYAYGMIFSVDGRGRATLHFPSAVDQPSALKGQGEIALPFAYELDDAPGFERFYFVASPEPLPVAAIFAKADKKPAGADLTAITLDLPAKAKMSSIEIRKAKDE